MSYHVTLHVNEHTAMAGGRRDVPWLQLVVKAVKPVTTVQALVLIFVSVKP